MSCAFSEEFVIFFHIQLNLLFVTNLTSGIEVNKSALDRTRMGFANNHTTSHRHATQVYIIMYALTSSTESEHYEYLIRFYLFSSVGMFSMELSLGQRMNTCRSRKMQKKRDAGDFADRTE